MSKEELVERLLKSQAEKRKQKIKVYEDYVSNACRRMKSARRK